MEALFLLDVALHSYRHNIVYDVIEPYNSCACRIKLREIIGIEFVRSLRLGLR